MNTRNLYIPNSTHFGSIKNRMDYEWSDDFTASQDKDFKWTGSETATCNLNDAPNMVPAIGSSCLMPGWTWLIVSGCTVKNIGGDLCEITVNYGGMLDKDDNPTDESKMTTKLGVSLSDEPLFRHFRYKDIPIGEKSTIRDYINGRLETSVDNQYRLIATTEHDNGAYEQVSTALGKELLDNVRSGFTTYKVATQTWEVSFKTKKSPDPQHYLNWVGFIKVPEKAPAIANDRNWLFTGLNVETSDDKIYSVTYTFILSGPGGWDSTIYAKPA